MTEEAVEMVECALTGVSVDAKTAVTLTLGEDQEPVILDPKVMLLALDQNPHVLNVVLEKCALNDEIFASIRSFRELSLAKNTGVQQGAAAAVQALKEKAKEEGNEEAFVELLNKTFPAPEEATSVAN